MLIVAAVGLATVGARVDTWLLERLDASRFRRFTTAVILALGAVCVLMGARDLALA